MIEQNTDFFISYDKADKQWAKWIAATLESKGYSSYIQAWDYRPGDNFVLEMQIALVNSKRFIAVLSNDYLNSLYCQAEWSTAFTKDPNSEKRLFIPIRISDIEPEGLLATVVYVDLFEKDEETATRLLLQSIDTKDIPRNRPAFPGQVSIEYPLNTAQNNPSQSVKSMILSQYKQEKAKYVSFCDRVIRLITDLLQQNSMEVHSISSRIKDADSLEKKIELKHLKYSNLQDITDIAGIRIITYYNDQVDAIAQMLESEFNIDVENTIDKRKVIAPDRFGYLSLHYVVQLDDKRNTLAEYRDFKDYKLEIQVRTILQHTWAEIEHDLGYKPLQPLPIDVQRDFYRLAGLLELADKEFLGIKRQLEKQKKEKKEMIKELMNNSPKSEITQISKIALDQLTKLDKGGKIDEV